MGQGIPSLVFTWPPPSTLNSISLCWSVECLAEAEFRHMNLSLSGRDAQPPLLAAGGKCTPG